MGNEIQCETCGNVYAKAFQVTINNSVHTFDCFECAIQRLAPTCVHCGCRIIGHGVELPDRLSGDGRNLEGGIFCGDHCARHGFLEAEVETNT